MDTGDIIYFVLMIGAVVVSLIKKKLDSNKEVGMPEQKVPDMMKEVFPDFKNWLDPEDEEPILEEVKAEVITPKQPLRTEMPVQKHFTYENSASFADDRSYLHTDKINSAPEYITKSYFEDEELDMRQAIVYATILKRPDY